VIDLMRRSPEGSAFTTRTGSYGKQSAHLIDRRAGWMTDEKDASRRRDLDAKTRSESDARVERGVLWCLFY